MPEPTNGLFGVWLRVWLWWRGDRVFVCPQCGKLWPRTTVIYGEVCTGTYNLVHPRRWMKRARVAGRMNPVERVGRALSWDAEWR